MLLLFPTSMTISNALCACGANNSVSFICRESHKVLKELEIREKPEALFYQNKFTKTLYPLLLI